MKPESGFEILDHAADVRVRLKASGPAELVVAAAGATAFLLAGAVRPDAGERVEWAGRAEDLEQVLVDVCNELIFLYETKGLVFPVLEVLGLDLPFYRVAVWGGRVPGSGGKQGARPKAATYGGLSVAEAADGSWAAEMIFDV